MVSRRWNKHSQNGCTSVPARYCVLRLLLLLRNWWDYSVTIAATTQLIRIPTAQLFRLLWSYFATIAAISRLPQDYATFTCQSRNFEWFNTSLPQNRANYDHAGHGIRVGPMWAKLGATGASDLATSWKWQRIIWWTPHGLFIMDRKWAPHVGPMAVAHVSQKTILLTGIVQPSFLCTFYVCTVRELVVGNVGCP